MLEIRTSGSVSPPLTSRLRLAAAIILLLAALGWTACSIEKNYKLLSFFFDGVPDPNLVATAKDAVQFAKATGGVYYVHQPYAQEQCGECHTDPSAGLSTSVDARACAKCHASVETEHRLMHGPVAAGACLWCHAPHESTIKPLMRADGPTVCTQCHGPALMGSPTSPAHEDLTRNCLDCHWGHGGDQRYFLNENWQELKSHFPAALAPADIDAQPSIVRRTGHGD